MDCRDKCFQDKFFYFYLSLYTDGLLSPCPPKLGSAGSISTQDVSEITQVGQTVKLLDPIVKGIVYFNWNLINVLHVNHTLHILHFELKYKRDGKTYIKLKAE